MRNELTVLVLAADPFRGEARLELGEEVRAIDQAIQRGSARDAVRLMPHFATRAHDLQTALLRHQPQVVHFAGHGGADGALYLGDEHGRPRAAGRAALGRLFQILKGEVRAVVLNACDTLPLVEELSPVVDFVIGTNRRITDQGAATFAAAFYGALAFGRGVGQSFDLAVNQLMLDGSHEDGTPVLRVRPGALDEPLAAAPSPSGREGSDGPIRQRTRVDGIDGGDLAVVGERRRGDAGNAGRRVDQDTHIGTISAGKVRILGSDSGASGRD